MNEPRKPFLSITPDVDDDAIARLARTKGVPELTSSRDAGPRRQIVVPETSANDRVSEAKGREGEGALINHIAAERVTTPEAEAAGPTPRGRISYVKAGIPDYALIELKTRALTEKVSLNHLLLAALKQAGIHIRDADMIEDGRRLR
jgi:hypothetical protein